MLARNTLIAITVISLLTVSMFFLARLAFNHAPELMAASAPRLNTFLLIHIFSIFMMVWFAMLKQVYEFTRWGLVLSTVTALLITACEVYIRAANLQKPVYRLSQMGAAEMGYLNCYFILYMYALIGAFLCGCFIVITDCYIRYREVKLRAAIQECVKPVSYESSMEGFECVICLSEIDENSEILRIKCKHYFHRTCLLDWMNEKTTCPTCRFDIFEAMELENQELMDGML